MVFTSNSAVKLDSMDPAMNVGVNCAGPRVDDTIQQSALLERTP